MVRGCECELEWECGCGFKDGTQLSQVRPDVPGFVSKPVLTMCIDQGSVGWSGAHYLMYKLKLRVLLLADPSHRAWRDARLAVSRAGLWDSVVLLGVPFGLNYGPFSQAAWFRQSQEAAKACGYIAHE